MLHVTVIITHIDNSTTTITHAIGVGKSPTNEVGIVQCNGNIVYPKNVRDIDVQENNPDAEPSVTNNTLELAKLN